MQWLKNIDEKNNAERKPPGPSLKKSQPECNDSEGTASESEIEHPATKKVKCAAKTAPTPAAPQNKKKVAAVPNKGRSRKLGATFPTCVWYFFSAVFSAKKQAYFLFYDQPIGEKLPYVRYFSKP